MPLRAIIDGQDCISTDLTPEVWSQLKKRTKSKEVSVTLPCCGEEAYLRTSKNDVNHFVHLQKNETCNWSSESKLHRHAKLEILNACRKCGWEAFPEFIEGEWRADVLATKNGRRIAFEVQLSRQSYRDTIERQAKYRESRVEAYWFFKTVSKDFIAPNFKLKENKELPVFMLAEEDDGTIVVLLNRRKFPLKHLLKSCLINKLSFATQLDRLHNKKFKLEYMKQLAGVVKKNNIRIYSQLL